MSRSWRSLGRSIECIAVTRVTKTMSHKRKQFLPNLDSDRHVPTTHHRLLISNARGAGASGQRAATPRGASRVADTRAFARVRARAVPDATRIRTRPLIGPARPPHTLPSPPPRIPPREPRAPTRCADIARRARRSARSRPPPSLRRGRTFASRASPRSFAPPRAPSRVPRRETTTRPRPRLRPPQPPPPARV